MNPKEVVNRYVGAKVAMTKCLQKNFRQVCGRCLMRDRGCKTIKEYYEAWQGLQALGKESDESIERN